MLASQRRREILRRLATFGYVAARELAFDFGVDASTIRRDLEALARAGHARRTHGGVLPMASEAVDVPYATRQHERVPHKMAIAAAAAACIRDGETIILDSGSTTYQLADALRSRSDLTVITNDLRIAKRLAERPGPRLLVTGGELLGSVYTLVGEHAVAFLRELRADRVFLGADAIDARAGITNTNMLEVPIKRTMLAVAGRRVVLADSTKFGQRALARVAGVTDVDEILTDDELAPQEAAAYLGRVHRVPVAATAATGAAGSRPAGE